VKNFFDVQSAFFIPLWRRIIVVVLTLGWGIFEFVSGSGTWGGLFVGAGLYCAHQFFIAFDPPAPDKAANKDLDPPV